MLKLFEINQELVNVNDMMEHWALDHEGDITDFPLFEEMEKLGMDLATKALNTAAVIKSIEAEAVGVRSVMELQQKRIKTLESIVDRLKAYLQNNIQPGQTFSDSRAQIKWGKSSAVVVECPPEELEDAYVRVKTELSPDKKAIKAAIESGIEIPGARIETRHNIQIK